MENVLRIRRGFCYLSKDNSIKIEINRWILWIIINYFFRFMAEGNLTMDTIIQSKFWTYIIKKAIIEYAGRDDAKMCA